MVKLNTPVNIIGFDGKASGQAGYIIGLHFQIAEWRFQKLPFLILDTGKQDLIVGQNFLKQHDIWLVIQNHQMIWPNNWAQAADCYIDYNINNSSIQPIQWTPMESAKEIKILHCKLTTLKAKSEHQVDADWRDQQIADGEGQQEQLKWETVSPNY